MNVPEHLNRLIMLASCAACVLGCYVACASEPAPAQTVPDGSGSATGDENDPYLWLEDVTGDKALTWVKEQNAQSTKELEASPVFESTQKRRPQKTSNHGSAPVEGNKTGGCPGSEAADFGQREIVHQKASDRHFRADVRENPNRAKDKVPMSPD